MFMAALSSFRWRRVFHWKYSNGLTLFIAGMGLAMVGIGADLDSLAWAFTIAYVLFSVSAIFALVAWLTSDFLRKRDPFTWNRQRRKAQDLKRARRKMLTWKYVLALAIISLLASCFWVTSAVQKAKELSRLGGILYPANDPDPPNPCSEPIPDNALAISYGGRVAYTKKAQTLIFLRASDARGGHDDNKSLILDADIRSEDGKIVARITKNHFAVNRNKILESLYYRPDESTVKLEDEYGNDFEVRYLNRRFIKFSGITYVYGTKVEIGNNGVAIGGKHLTVDSPCMGDNAERPPGQAFYIINIRTNLH